MARPPLNLLLHGPPGTGKTRSAIIRAVWAAEGIAGHDEDDVDFAEAKAHFDRLCEAGRIEVVAFHPGFGYEHFVEGFMPVRHEDGVRRELRPGVLRVLAARAASALRRAQGGTTRLERDAAFEDAYARLLHAIRHADAGGILVPMTMGTPLRVSFGGRDGVHVAPEGRPGSTFLGRDKLLRYWLRWERLRSPLDIDEPDAPAIWALISHLRPSGGPEPPGHALLIDGLCRGDAGRIFGEAVTLLDADRRLGTPGELSVRLPLSGDAFALPPNLHLVATASTPAAFDPVLRRRFALVEMLPRPEILDEDVDGIDLGALLHAMNRRLGSCLGQSHQIGHGYLAGVDSFDALVEVFHQRLLPLLEVVCGGDWALVRSILRDTEAPRAHQIVREETISPRDAELLASLGRAPAMSYRPSETIGPEAVRKIYR